jgi:hypothetical protein
VADPIDKVVRNGSQKGTMHALAPTLSHWTLQARPSTASWFETALSAPPHHEGLSSRSRNALILRAAVSGRFEGWLRKDCPPQLFLRMRQPCRRRCASLTWPDA